jgi:hypothetical protein
MSILFRGKQTVHMHAHTYITVIFRCLKLILNSKSDGKGGQTRLDCPCKCVKERDRQRDVEVNLKKKKSVLLCYNSIVGGPCCLRISQDGSNTFLRNTSYNS